MYTSGDIKMELLENTCTLKCAEAIIKLDKSVGRGLSAKPNGNDKMNDFDYYDGI